MTLSTIVIVLPIVIVFTDLIYSCTIVIVVNFNYRPALIQTFVPNSSKHGEEVLSIQSGMVWMVLLSDFHFKVESNCRLNSNYNAILSTRLVHRCICWSGKCCTNFSAAKDDYYSYLVTCDTIQSNMTYRKVWLLGAHGC